MRNLLAEAAEGRCIGVGGLAHTSKGGGAMYFFYLTVHIHGYVFSLRIEKDNRHPAR